MRKTMIGTLCFTALIAGGATAQEGQKPQPPEEQRATKDKQQQKAAGAEMSLPKKPGEQTRALLPIAVDATWVGKLAANAKGEGSPEMTTRGKQDCAWEVNNLWLTCEVQDSMGGKDGEMWRGRFTLGYDYFANEYRATMIDNAGHASLLTGKMEGDNKLVLTTSMPIQMDNKSYQTRVTYDWSDPNSIRFRSERSVDGGGFEVMQTATMRPTKREKLPPAA
jgi:hypothetical protein